MKNTVGKVTYTNCIVVCQSVTCELAFFVSYDEFQNL